MERRRFFGLGVAGVTAASGIGAAKLLNLGTFSHSPSLPPGMQVEVRIVLESAVQAETNDFEDGHSTVVSNETAADTKFTESAVVDEAVANTDVPTEYLAVSFVWTSPNEELPLGAIERRVDGLQVTVKAVRGVVERQRTQRRSSSESGTQKRTHPQR